MPGVIPHQGEGNRDQSSSAGSAPTPTSSSTACATTCSIIRDIYNMQRVEVLKGPNAMIFGRGGGGGVINRVLKEADGVARHAR